MKQNQNSTGLPCAALRLCQRETAAHVAGCCNSSPNGKCPRGCNLAGVDANNGDTKSGQTRVRLPVRFLRTVTFYLALLLLTVKVAVGQEVGELSPRTAPKSTEAALSLLQTARQAVQTNIAVMRNHADGVDAARNAYQDNPTPATATLLFQRMAEKAGEGQRASSNISANAFSGARACASLSARCLIDAAALSPNRDKAHRTQAESSKAREAGRSELELAHRRLREQGVTNDLAIDKDERRRISQLLRLCGHADLAAKFAGMEANATDLVIQRLTALADQFATRRETFEDLGRAFALHADSFKATAAWSANMAGLVAMNGHYTDENAAAAGLEGDLTKLDMAITQDFLAQEVDFTSAFAPGKADSAPGDAGGPSLWHRLLRFIGVEQAQQPSVATTETGGELK